MSSVVTQAEPRFKAKARARATNERLRGRITAKSLFGDEIDGRSQWARRYRDVVALFVADAGGLSGLTELKLAMIRRAAALTLECERLEVGLSRGEKVDVDLLARLSSHSRRIAETIGLNRVARDITPSLSDIIAAHTASPDGKPETGRVTPIASGPVSLTQTPSALDGDGDEGDGGREAAE